MSADAPPAPKKSKTLLVVALSAVLVLGGAGAAGFWWMNQKHEGGDAPAGKAASRKPSFSNIDPFTVNLRDDRGERFAQIGVTFEIDDPAVDAEIKDHLPAVRNNILLLISSKRIEDLLTPEGKQLLADEIRDKAGLALGITPERRPAAPSANGAEADEAQPRRERSSRGGRENPIRAVLFSQFIVQ